MEEIIFPNQIRMIRRTRGRTMKEIASILGVSLSAISKIEKGYRRVDDVQIEKICGFLNCPKESIFVYEKTSQPEVLRAWEKEKERRKQINEKSGLKTLGAGFRYLRGEKMLTLQDVAKGSGLTLSVYHRIEMGQREVTEDQFSKIAHALGFTPEDLQLKIYELDMAGSLQEFKKTGQPGVFHPKGGYNDLPLRNISFDAAGTEVDLYEQSGKDPVKTRLFLPDLSYSYAVPMPEYTGFNGAKAVVSKDSTVRENDFAICEMGGQFIFGSVLKKDESFFLKTQSGNELSVLPANLKKITAILM